MAYEYGQLARPIAETLAAIEAGLLREHRSRRRPAHRLSPRRARRLRRIRGWARETGRLASGAGRMVHEVLPRIERDTGHTFAGPDGLVRIMMDPSTKRLFLGILAGFPEEALPVPARDLVCLEAFSDDALALALIGDVTLRLKVLTGPKVDSLAVLADRWSLHENRIGFSCRRCPLGDILLWEKETLARAVLGLICVEGGADTLRLTLPLLLSDPAG